MKKIKKVVIIGGGFAGLNCAKIIGKNSSISVTLLDKQNHHLFQPLLYQVAMAGLSPAEIAAPIRRLVAEYDNTSVIKASVNKINSDEKKIFFDLDGQLEFDYLVVACGATHSYFGKDKWETLAPGLKTLSQATEIRRRVLQAFEDAEKCSDPTIRKSLLTFIVIGGGPTGVELAGALGEMTRYTLSKDFKTIDSKQARILLIEGSSRILPTFSSKLSEKAQRDLERLGVHVWTDSLVTDIMKDGVKVSSEFIKANTVLWAAGVQASDLGKNSGWSIDSAGRVFVEPDLSIPNNKNIFVLGDMASIKDKPLPGIAPVAMQQGRFIGKLISKEISGKLKERPPFTYLDKGQLATIGRSKAILEIGSIKVSGFIAWLVWIVVHIYYLTGFKNRAFVVMHWIWSYLNFKKGARLIVEKNWRSKK